MASRATAKGDPFRTPTRADAGLRGGLTRSSSSRHDDVWVGGRRAGPCGASSSASAKAATTELCCACIKKFDRAKLDLKPRSPRARSGTRRARSIDPADRAALGKAAMRVREFHRKRIPSSWEVREEGGGVFGQRVRPLQRVGLYVPGGRGRSIPRAVIMNAVPGVGGGGAGDRDGYAAGAGRIHPRPRC